MADSTRAREGLVIQHGANRYLVEMPATESEGRRVLACTLAGRLRQGRRSNVRLAVIGDRVRLADDRRSEAGTGVIEAVLPRRNKISRPAPSGGLRKSLEQVVIANLDRIWVTASLDQPTLNLPFVDRVLAASRHQGVDAGLVLNKADLPGAPDTAPLETLYGGLGYPVFVVSAVDGRGIDGLREAFAGRIGAFVGLSGVGKSSLLSRLQPGLEIRVASVGEKSGQGRHTTTGSHLYPLDNGGYLADTPGMREFGLWGMAKRELSDCFVEFDERAPDCRFRDCLHAGEPGCVVRRAAEAEELDPGRYQRYLALLAELPEETDGWRDRPRGGRDTS